MNAEQTESVVAEFEEIVPQMARRLMRKFYVTDTSQEDLVSCGYIALVEAAERYETSDRDCFKNYVALRVRGAMIDHLRSSTILSGKSRRYIKALSAIQLMREEDLLEDPLFAENKKEPEDNLAHILDLAAKGAIAFRLSMDEADSDLMSLTDQQPSAEQQLSDQQRSNAIKDLIKKLPKKERVIIEDYYFNDKSFKEIAAQNRGMNKSWVSRLHSRALSNLRNMIYEGDCHEECL